CRAFCAPAQGGRLDARCQGDGRVRRVRRNGGQVRGAIERCTALAGIAAGRNLALARRWRHICLTSRARREISLYCIMVLRFDRESLRIGSPALLYSAGRPCGARWGEKPDVTTT